MPIAQMDYKGAKIVMEAENQVEQAFRLHACAKEPWTVGFIEAMPPGSVLWDLGANVGAYTLIGVSRGLSVVAVEPACNNYAALCRNLALNNMLDRAFVLCCALGEHSGFDWLHYQDMRQGAANHVIGGTRRRFFHQQMIPVWTWDELWPRLPFSIAAPHYAKIDVDGGELRLLRGAPWVLAQPKLRGLMVEMQAPDEAEIVKLLGAAGFVLAERFGERGGQPIPGMAYGRFERAR